MFAVCLDAIEMLFVLFQHAYTAYDDGEASLDEEPRTSPEIHRNFKYNIMVSFRFLYNPYQSYR